MKKFRVLNIFIALSISTLIVIFSGAGFLKRLELLGSDSFFRFRKPLASNPHLIVVEINDENISKVGRWPWKRTWHAAITKALSELGAKYIFFDILFSEAAEEEEDSLFAEAIKNTGKVYLPFAFQSSADYRNPLLPIKNLSPHTKGTGSINIFPDLDGILRRIPLFFIKEKDINTPVSPRINLNLSQRIDYHIALKIAMDYQGLEIKDIKSKYLLLAGSKGEIRVPLVEGNKMLINWTGKWKDTFKHYSFLEVLSGYQDFLEHKKPKIDLGHFKDSICVIAVTALGLYDIKPAPLEPEYPGVGATITAMNNILERQFLKVPPVWLNWLFIYILSLLPPILISEEKPLREILSIFSVVAVFFIGNLLFKRNIMVDIFLPLFSLFASYIGVGTYNFTRLSLESKRFQKLAITDGLTGLYNIRYFKMILKTERLLAKADSSKNFGIVMADIDHFKQFNDTYGHQLGDLVLEQIAKVILISVRASDIVARYGGEEIIILLRGAIPLEDGLNVAEKIRKNIERHPIRKEDNIYKVTASFGVSCFRPQDDLETVIKRADSALYEAKQKGRNCVCAVEDSPF